MDYVVAYLLIGLVLGCLVARPRRVWWMWIPLWLPILIIFFGEWVNAREKNRTEGR